MVDLERNKVLLVTERYECHKSSKHKLPQWKIPGGQLDDPDESIGDAAVREAREETGVECEFVALLCFRHLHSFRFGKSDMYFVCLCKPKDSSKLPDLNPDPHEIAQCEWIDIDDYFAMNHLTSVQVEARDALKRYINDPSKCLASKDVSQFNKSARMYFVG